MKSITVEQLLWNYNNPDWAISLHDFNGRLIPATITKKANFLDAVTHCKNKYVRDALWLGAKILSSDDAIKRMADYLNLPKIKVAGLA